MIITIDTSKDSEKDIVRAIEFLKEFIRKNDHTQYPPDFLTTPSQTDSSSTDQTPSSGFFNMFGDSSSPKDAPDTNTMQNPYKEDISEKTQEGEASKQNFKIEPY